jgi:pimeloyl-ACP methyl ester carboxylesterase
MTGILVSGVEVTVDEQGSGRPVLVLHGGGGPFTVANISAHLAPSRQVLTPTHPGWNGTARPEWLTGVDDLAMLYLRLLKQRGLRDVAVVGSSMGGWIAAEMAVRDLGDIIGGLVLVDMVGVEVPGETIVDFFSLTPRGIAEHSYHQPDKFFVDPATLPPERVALQRGNIATLKAIAGTRMADPKLLRRLGEVEVPALVLWGESDRIATPGYGRALAAALPKGRFEVVKGAGHLPQFEQPEAIFAAIDGFLTTAR